MGGIDQVSFSIDQRFGLIIGLMTAFMVFSVGLDLKWDDFRRVMRAPKAPLVGLIGQFVILPAAGFAVGMAFVDQPSVALGLLVVCCCPGGAVSNYITHLAKGDVATSVSMTAVSTVACVVVTPLLLALWSSQNPDIWGLVEGVDVDRKMVVMMFVVTVGVPIVAGMLVRAKKPNTATAIRPWVGRLSVVLLLIVVVIATSSYGKYVLDYAKLAFVPVAISFTVAVSVGWILAALIRVGERQRRAVIIEIGGQNVAIAAALSITFFPQLAGAAVTVAAWGIMQNLAYLTLMVIWARMPTPAADS